MKQGIAIAALAIMAVPASAQTTGPLTARENTPQVQASTTVTSTDGNNRTLSVPVTSLVGATQPRALGAGSIATAQVSAGTGATLIAAARATRSQITVSVGAANTCAFGNTGVTPTTGFPLQPTAGAALTMHTTAAIYAVCSATTTINVLEQF